MIYGTLLRRRNRDDGVTVFPNASTLQVATRSGRIVTIPAGWYASGRCICTPSSVAYHIDPDGYLIGRLRPKEAREEGHAVRGT